MMHAFPCRDCQQRRLLCHAECPAYRAYKEQRDKQLAAYRQERRAYDSAVAQAVAGAARARRKRRK